MEKLSTHQLAMCISNVQQAGEVSLERVPDRIEPKSLLMCEPSFFEVKDAKNPFMEGNLNQIDSRRAAGQWENLKATFEQLGFPVQIIQAQPGLEDMVFTANQVLPGIQKDGKRYAVLSRMRHDSRAREIPFFDEWFRLRGYEVLNLCGESNRAPWFEGQGDAIWHPGKRLLWGGYGFRTEERAYDFLCRLLAVPIVKLKLVNEKFYHLDTAFCAIDINTVMIYPAAFDEAGLDLIRHYFRDVIEVTGREADNFACNAVALGGKVVIQRGSPEVCRRLTELGFAPVEVETGEFMKSGGSVFCLKMGIY